jgi:hypothetical protein
MPVGVIVGMRVSVVVGAVHVSVGHG